MVKIPWEIGYAWYKGGEAFKRAKKQEGWLIETSGIDRNEATEYTKAYLDGWTHAMQEVCKLPGVTVEDLPPESN